MDMKTALARHATARLCSKEAEDAATRPDVAHHLTLKVGAVLEDRRIVCSRPAPSTLRSYPYLLARKLSVASSQADAPALCRVLTETCRRCHLEGAPYVILEHVLLVLQETIVPARGALRMLSCLLCHRTLTQQPALLNGQCYVPSDRALEDSCRPQGFAIGALALNSLSLLPPGHGMRTPEVQVRRALVCFAAELAALPHTPWASYETMEAWRCSRTCMSLQAEAAASRTVFVGAPPYPAAPPVRAPQPQQARPQRPAPRSARHTHAASQAERQAP